MRVSLSVFRVPSFLSVSELSHINAHHTPVRIDSVVLFSVYRTKILATANQIFNACFELEY